LESFTLRLLNQQVCFIVIIFVVFVSRWLDNERKLSASLCTPSGIVQTDCGPVQGTVDEHGSYRLGTLSMLSARLRQKWQSLPHGNNLSQYHVVRQHKSLTYLLTIGV
jgi:hypothetical protein